MNTNTKNTEHYLQITFLAEVQCLQIIFFGGGTLPPNSHFHRNIRAGLTIPVAYIAYPCSFKTNIPTESSSED